MATTDYRFLTHWRVRGTAGDVFAILSDPAGYPRWWSDVFLDVRETGGYGPDGRARRADIYSKGRLPYTLRWQARVVEVRLGRGFTLEATGDFIGRGVWNFRQDGDWVDITYDWTVRAQKPFLRYLSFLLKPIFAANHHWAMRQGEKGLQRELARVAASRDYDEKWSLDEGWRPAFGLAVAA
jgi:hypothetical protein